MKVSIIKKMLLGALTASLVMAPMMSVSATDETNAESVVNQVVEEAEPDRGWTGEIPNTSNVGSVKSTTNGTYLATAVNGSAITTSGASIAAGYGLTGNETPYAKFFNLDAKKSHLAAAAINEAAASQGAVVGPMINIELGKMSSGKYSLLPSDGADIRIAIGVPSNFQNAGKTFAMVCVQAGGAVSILPDIDENPATVTFDTKGGAGAYAIIRY